MNAARAEGFADGIEAAALEAGLDNRKAMRRTPSEVAAAIRALRPDSSLVVLPREAVGEP